jgi:Leucine-rich repeat (LRR) protein
LITISINKIKNNPKPKIMKTIILSVLVLTMAFISNAQNLNIPDADFKNALISVGVDINEDGEISYAEAEAITYLNFRERSISDMKGIEAFVNLDTLICDANQLTNLDVSHNTALKYLTCNANYLHSLNVSNNIDLQKLECSWNLLISLDVSGYTALNRLGCYDNLLTTLDVSGCNGLTNLDCSQNQLTSLDISGFTTLTYLGCSGNQLTSLDVSKNTALTELYCDYNQITSLGVSGFSALTKLECDGNQLTILDVSKSTTLWYLDCANNQLTSLDVSNNRGLIQLLLSDMPTLYEVCVWEMPFPPEDIEVNSARSPNVYFTTDCAETALKPTEVNSKLNIYPNPSDDIINIEIENKNNATIEIYDVNGTLIFSKALNSESEKIDISGFSGGIYLVKVKQDSTVIIEKVVVR